MLDFRLKNGEGVISLVALTKDIATVIVPGKFVTLDGSDLAIEADQTSTQIAFAPFGALEGALEVLVVKELDAIYIGTGDRKFNMFTDKANAIDIVMSGSDQLIDLDHSATGVLRTVAENDGGKDGSDKNIEVLINKGLGILTAGGSGLTSINGSTGPAIIVAGGTDISVTESPANTFTIDYTGAAGIMVQYQTEGSNLGTAGTVDTINFDSSMVVTRIGNTIHVDVPDVDTGGGLSDYGKFFQTVADVGATIASDNGKALFQTADSNNTPATFTMTPASGDITVNTAGVYEINWEITCAEAGAMSLYIGAAKQIGTCYGTGAGTQNITGTALLLLGVGDVVSLRSDNCPAALTLQLAGTTNTGMIVAGITFKKIAGI